jgi:hypothetical protein
LDEQLDRKLALALETLRDLLAVEPRRKAGADTGDHHHRNGTVVPSLFE